MYLFRNLVAVFALICFYLDVCAISIVFKSTEQAYWYGKARSARSGNENSEFRDICFYLSEDLYSKLSPAETLCFLSGILREDHPTLNKLIIWKYVKDNKLRISSKDIISLRSDNSTLKIHLESNKDLLEKIKKFWGINKNTNLYCFYSRANYLSGSCLNNFIYSNDVYAMILMCGPPLSSNVMSLNEHLCIIAHEFSHAMFDAASWDKRIEEITSKLQSPNSVIAGWYLNEALAIVLGNGLFKESISKTKVDLRKAEYCARGFAPALYDLAKDYFDNSKAIDEHFIENAVKIFDKVHPNGYMNPNIYLYYVYAIYPDEINEHEIISKLSRKTAIFSFYYTPFSKLTNDKAKEIKDTSCTTMVIFKNKKQLNPLKDILPKFDDKAPISVIHKNKKTYVLIKIDDKHSLEDRIDELFSGINN